MVAGVSLTDRCAAQAGFVDYDSVGFREKNKDSLHPDMFGMMAASASPFVVSLFPNEGAAAATRGRPKTLASQFKLSLQALIDRINETAVHYVRCIKPNQNTSKSEFDLQGVHEQLRCQVRTQQIYQSPACIYS